MAWQEGLEAHAEAELEGFFLVAIFFLDGYGVAQVKRPQGGHPLYEKAAGIAEFAEVEVFGFAVHVTEVNEGADADIVGFFVDFPRGHQLNAADGTEVATRGVAVAVTRAERAVLEAAHSSEAAGVVVTVEGQVIGFAVTTTVSDVAPQAEDEAFIVVKREVGAVAVTDFVVGVV